MGKKVDTAIFITLFWCWKERLNNNKNVLITHKYVQLKVDSIWMWKWPIKRTKRTELILKLVLWSNGFSWKRRNMCFFYCRLVIKYVGKCTEMALRRAFIPIDSNGFNLLGMVILCDCYAWNCKQLISNPLMYSSIFETFSLIADTFKFYASFGY